MLQQHFASMEEGTFHGQFQSAVQFARRSSQDIADLFTIPERHGYSCRHQALSAQMSAFDSACYSKLEKAPKKRSLSTENTTADNVRQDILVGRSVYADSVAGVDANPI